MDVEDPAEEVRRLRAQIAELQHDRAAKQEAEESCQEGSDSLDATVGFVPDSFWSGRSAQCLRCDANPNRPIPHCEKFEARDPSQVSQQVRSQSDQSGRSIESGPSKVSQKVAPWCVDHL